MWVCEFHVLQWEIGMRTIMFYIKNIIFYFKLQKVKTCNCLVTLLNKIVHTAVTRTANSANKLTINISKQEKKKKNILKLKLTLTVQNMYIIYNIKIQKRNETTNHPVLFF